MIQPGDLLASGRAADVFDQGDGTVLRRYRTEHDCGPEARLMRWLHDRGFPVPRVHHAAGRDMVMERISGSTMLEDLDRRPWMVLRHVRTLSELQKALGALPAPSWVGTDRRIPDGPSLLHLDLHPLNVIVGPDGPVVIDWTNARRGDADFDAALSYILIAAYEAQGIREAVAKQLIARAFRRSRGRSPVRRRLPEAAAYRLDDPNVTAGERAAIDRMLRRAG